MLNDTIFYISLIYSIYAKKAHFYLIWANEQDEAIFKYLAQEIKERERQSSITDPVKKPENKPKIVELG